MYDPLLWFGPPIALLAVLFVAIVAIVGWLVRRARRRLQWSLRRQLLTAIVVIVPSVLLAYVIVGVALGYWLESDVLSRIVYYAASDCRRLADVEVGTTASELSEMLSGETLLCPATIPLTEEPSGVSCEKFRLDIANQDCELVVAPRIGRLDTSLLLDRRVFRSCSTPYSERVISSGSDHWYQFDVSSEGIIVGVCSDTTYWDG